MKAVYKNAKSSVQKINLVANLVRGMPVEKAKYALLFTNRYASKYISKTLTSSVANAQNNLSIDVDSLYVKSILVSKGMSLKRTSPRARGRAARVVKHYSHITVLLGVIDGSKS